MPGRGTWTAFNCYLLAADRHWLLPWLSGMYLDTASCVEIIERAWPLLRDDRSGEYKCDREWEEYSFHTAGAGRC